MEEKLIVFISSRINDEMMQARQVVREAIEELPLTRAWVFEESPASADELAESYLRWVRQCDLFILLLGEDITDPVKTEWEIATKVDKPRLVFLKKGVQNEEAWEFAKGLGIKWKEYETLDKLKREAQVAVGDELIKGYRTYRMSRQERKAVAAFIGRRLPIHTIAAITTALAAIVIAAYLLWPSPQPPSTTVIADSSALRNGPGLEYASITTLPQRKRLTLLGKTPNRAWLKVCTENGIEGWISRGAVGADDKVIAKLTSLSGPPLPTPTPPLTPTPTATVTATSTPTSTPSPPSVSYEILLDCSKLMEAEFADSGHSKLEEAKRAIRKLIGTLVDPYFVAIRVFGHNELAGEATCEDTALLLSPDRAETQRSRLSDVLAPLEPSGGSALAAALREGLSELLKSGSETLVLTIFVGGRDDCTGDVQDVIQNNVIVPDRDIALEVHLVSLDAGEVEEFEEATQLQVSDRVFRFDYKDVKSEVDTDDTMGDIVEVMPTLLPSELTPTSTPSPTATPPAPISSPTAIPVVTSTNTPTATPTGTPTATNTLTNTPTVTPTGTPTATNTPANTPTATPTNTPTATPMPTPTPTPFFCTNSGRGITETITVELPHPIGGIHINLIERALQQYGFSLWEVEIYGPGTGNLAIGATPTASSSQNSYGCYGCSPDKAIDSRMDTRWGSHFTEPQHFTITLPISQVVDRIVLKWENAYATKYCITVIE